MVEPLLITGSEWKNRYTASGGGLVADNSGPGNPGGSGGGGTSGDASSVNSPDPLSPDKQGHAGGNDGNNWWWCRYWQDLLDWWCWFTIDCTTQINPGISMPMAWQFCWQCWRICWWRIWS